MKTSHTILLDLLISQSTLDSIAERLIQPRPVIAAFLADLETDGLVESTPIGNATIGRNLTAWRITPAGRQLTETLLQPA